MSERNQRLFYCLECDELAQWRVWYAGCVLPVGGGNIAYNSLCDEHATFEMKNGRDGWSVACVKKIEDNHPVNCPGCGSTEHTRMGCSVGIVFVCCDCKRRFTREGAIPGE